MAPPSGTTTSVQVAVRIRPTTSHDTLSIPARFQRTVVQAASSTTVQVDSAQSLAATPTPNSPSQSSPSSASQTKKQFFTFDQVHPPSTSQYTLFQSTADPLIGRFLQGFNCTVLAYGQTSSGKTYSMTGIDLDADPSDPDNGMGIIPRSISKIFERTRQIKEERGLSWTYTLKGSFIELYNEDLIDLLADDAVKRDVQIREDKDGNIIWGGLREVTVRNVGEVMSLIKQGTSIRRTNETDMNAQSSRSHAIFSLTLTQKKFTGSGLPTRSSSPLPPGRSPSRLGRPGSQYNTSSLPRVSSPTSGRPPTPSFQAAMNRGGGIVRPSSALGGRISPSKDKDDEEVGEWTTIISKFHFVDLAGSERLKRTAAAGERIKEGISINSGLLALGNVISALGDPSRAKSHTASHVPYRDSKLTRLLQDSLGGNANTLMIACVSPAEWNVAETVNTLKYANRARNIRNRAVINEKEDGWDDVEWLQNMVTRLRRDLKALKEGTNPSEESESTHTDHEHDESSRIAVQQFVELQSQHDELRRQFTQRTEELTRLRRELGESQRATGGSIPGTGKYEEIVGPVIEEYEKTIASMEAELSLNRAALRHTNSLVTEKEQELATVTERHAATEMYLEELRARVAKLSDREASTEAYIRDLEEKVKLFDEKSFSSSSAVADLKREIQQYRDAESHSAAYITDLEQRLGRTDETVLSLRERVQHLEHDVNSRAEAAEVLQKRLEELTSDGAAWRADLEHREVKLKELEKQLEVWEEKRKQANEDRERLGDVAGDVEKARRSLELDLLDTPEKRMKSTRDSDVEGQLTALQETHQATLADLASVTDKYRDALREISDLASQIQELKLQTSSQREPSDDGSDVPSTPRRRLTTGSGLRSPRGDGRRSFFRQAASTESLHARSLSQSQSLSQELSSARLSKHSLNGRPDSLTIPNSTRLSPTITRSMSYSQLPFIDSPTERSVASLEKEIMRLQEVLKEREAEISTLEESLKTKTNGVPHQIQDIPPIPEVDDVENELSDPSLNELSPTTLKQFKDLRRLSKRLSLQTPPESLTESSETLDRLNELMLSMAQKESQHRETVESLNAELSQVRRQYDELSTLSRNQALNMSTELEALRKEHLTTASELEELQLKHAEATTELENQLISQQNLRSGLEELRRHEMELLEQIRLVEESHAEAIERLQFEHEKALQAQGSEHQRTLEDVQSNHTEEKSRLLNQISNIELTSSKKQQEYEENFTKLRAEHASELERRSKEADLFVGQSQSEQTETLARLQGEHALALKKEIEEAQAKVEEIRDEHASTMEKLRNDHQALLSQKDDEHRKALEALEAAHALAFESSNTRHEEALRVVRLQYDNEIQALEQKHAKVLADQEEFTQSILDKLRQDQDIVHTELIKAHDIHVNTMKEEQAFTVAKLEGALNQLSRDKEDIRQNLDAALAQQQEKISEELNIAKKTHEATLETLQREHIEALNRLISEHDESIAGVRSGHEVEKELERTRLTDELVKLTAEHERALSEAHFTLESVKEEYKKSLEEHERRNEELCSQVAEQHAVALEELTETHRQEYESLAKDHEILVEEVAAYKAAMDEFAAAREQTREAHEETVIKKDLLIAALEEEVSVLKHKRVELNSTVENLRMELESTKTQTSELVQEASKRESLVDDLERHRSLLGDLQINLQKTRDERDSLAAEKLKQDEMLRQLQAQLEAHSVKSESPVSPRPIPEHRAGSLSRINGIPPPMTPPPAGPPPPTPGQTRVTTEGIQPRSSGTMSTTSRTSQLDNSTAPTSPILNGTSSGDPKILLRLEEQSRLLEEKETMIKTLNKQLTHCEGDLQAHMDLVSTLETQLNDSERNLRKARLQASEFSKERDRLSNQVETLRSEVQEAKREVVNVRRSVVEEKHSLEQRLDEERKAKERARAQLDARIEDLQKRKRCTTRTVDNLARTFLAKLIRSFGITPRSNAKTEGPVSRMLSELSLAGKVCVVTGGARGLGLVMGQGFVEAQSRHAISGCTSLALIDLAKANADAAASKLMTSFGDESIQDGLNVIGVECDVANEESVKRAMDETITKLGRIDVLVASADRMKKLYDINVHGCFYSAREAARHMLKQKSGSIILIASMSANIVNYPQLQTPYNTSKAAVKHMAASLGVEWAKEGVRVNAISPGYMLTELTKNILQGKGDLREKWETMTPMGRMGNPEELKGAAVFLASDSSRFVTASELRVDGGYAAI
ncbi:hypothetical protein Clacol_006563 [Clathrus columnatus]|uniref:Kinesin motor domain-containing protein n=1 Tax=Clathrus columnatus TaxID=1419009 RepID=A0AAV5AF08_9AGAM|nr:hypothetical protein Clacol_006563 [Clathrus columnatus]